MPLRGLSRVKGWELRKGEAHFLGPIPIALPNNKRHIRPQGAENSTRVATQGKGMLPTTLEKFRNSDKVTSMYASNVLLLVMNIQQKSWKTSV